MIIYLGDEIVSGVSRIDSISQFGHIMGGIMGIFWGFFFYKSGAERE